MAESAAAPAEVRVLIADCAELVRRGIRDVLTLDRRFKVVGEVAQPSDIAGACLELSPDIIFVGLGRDEDDTAGGSASLTALRQTSRLHPSARVIVLVDGDTVEDLLEPVRAGAKAVLLRDAPAGTLLEAARDVLAGGTALDPRLARSFFKWLAFSDDLVAVETPQLSLDSAALGVLSPREQEVLRALARGYRNKQIADELELSVGTVKTHLRHIFRKLGVADRTAAALIAYNVRLREAA